MKLMLLPATFMLMISHPLSMGFMILMQTILICLMLGMMYKNFWFSYILILIMIGGLLILFIYMTSIASNEKFNFNMKMALIMTLIMAFLMIYLKNNFNEMNELTNLEQNYNFLNSMNKYYNFPNYKIMLFTIIYLLITLIAVVKISKTNKGPLRQMF